MPRIRKKTSNRGTTHQRSRIKQKVAESRKKAKKAAKKNPQWKSKHAKDPGIPNNFPYKAQILAEVAAQRRQEEEEKQKRKEQRKAEKAAKKGQKDGNEKENEEEQVERDATGFDGITSVSSSALRVAAKDMKGKTRTAVQAVEEEDVPILMNTEYRDLKSVLEKADVVLQVLDARDPLASHSSQLQRYTDEKIKAKTFVVLNKIDTCPREVLQSWIKTLRKQHPTFLFRSASVFLPKMEEQGKASSTKTEEAAVSSIDAVGADALLQALASEAGKKTDGPLVVALVGIANTGKSAVLNSLFRKSISPVYKLTSSPSGPSTTERALEVVLEHDGKRLAFIDTPALSWVYPTDMDGAAAAAMRARDVLLRSKGRIDRIKEPLIPVTQIITRANTEDLMLFYTLPAFTPGDATAFLSALARRLGLVKKRGEVDLAGAARVVLRDWSTGRMRWVAVPPPSSGNGVVESRNEKAGEGEGYGEDEEVLKAAPTRREMRRGRGIVRLEPAPVETREVVLDVPWDEDGQGESDEEDEDGQNAEEDAKGEDDEVEDEDEDIDEAASASHQSDESEDGDEEPLPFPLPSTLKRKNAPKPTSKPSSSSSSAGPPPKKVAFASLPPSARTSKSKTTTLKMTTMKTKTTLKRMKMKNSR